MILMWDGRKIVCSQVIHLVSIINCQFKLWYYIFLNLLISISKFACISLRLYNMFSAYLMLSIRVQKVVIILQYGVLVVSAKDALMLT